MLGCTSGQGNRMADVFISYKREEKPRAELLRTVLESFGYSVWFDVELLSGDDFRSVIRAMIDECSAVVVLWSELAVESPFIRDEADYANSQGKILPACLEPCTLPMGFGGLHSPDLSGFEGDIDHPGFVQLRKSITAKVGRPAVIGAPSAQFEADRAMVRAFQAAAKLQSLDAWKRFQREYPAAPFRRFVEDEIKRLRETAPPGGGSSGDGTGGGEGSTGFKLVTSALIAALIAAIGAVGFMLFSGGSVSEGERALWEEAKALGSQAAYETYLKEYPEGEFDDAARLRLTTLQAEAEAVSDATNRADAWTQAQASNTLEGYEAFIEAYQDSDEAELARTEITKLLEAQDRDAWQRARAANTKAAYDAYLTNQSNGAFRDNAQTEINAITKRENDRKVAVAADRTAWETALRTNTVAAYQNYLDRFAQGAFRATAQEKIKTLNAAAEAARLERQVTAQASAAQNVVSRWEASAPKGDDDCNQNFVIYFEFDSSRIPSQGAAVIDQALANVAQCTIEAILVTGHTDTSGSNTYAFQIAERRANEISDYLRGKGVEPSIITTASLGETSLARETRDGVREPLNRRAEINMRASPNVTKTFVPFDLDLLHPDVRAAVVKARDVRRKAEDAERRALAAAETARDWARRAEAGEPGTAVILLDTGDKYAGQVNSDGKYQGFGVYTENLAGRLSASSEQPNGPVEASGLRIIVEDTTPGYPYYAGEFSEGKREGVGVLILQPGEDYSGMWQNNLRIGAGIYKSIDGSVVYGLFQMSPPSNEIVEIRHNGLISEGSRSSGYRAIWTARGAIAQQGRYENNRLIEPLSP